MTPFPKRLIRKKKRGFALIATLTLMMLLTLLAVGILALASSQNRISLQTILQAEARQQALVGLDAAIGELQVELGPDKRVSANSGILENEDSSGAQYLLGVWDSWDGPIYGRSLTGKGSSIRETYDKGRSKMFRRWLISSRDQGDTRRMDNAAKLTGRRPGERICLVGEGTLGTEFTARHYVYADLLTMPSVGNNKACFAWWVGAENQKAKVTITEPEESDDVEDVLHRTWNTPGPMFVNSETLSFLPERIEQPDKVVTLGTLPLVTSASQSPGTPWFFDVTTSSYSLPINVRTGGFKQDLNLLLNKETLRGTEFAARSNQDCPLVEGEDLPQGTESNMPIGSWQNMHAFYHCWPDGTANDSSNFTARLIGTLDNAYTRMSGSVSLEQGGKLQTGMIDNPDSAKVGKNDASFYDTRAMLETGSNTAGYARTPVMLAFMSNFALWTEPNMKADGTQYMTGDKNPIYDLCITYSPTVLWWNPYNVPMRIRGQQLWSHSAPYRVAWIQNFCVSSSGATLREWKKTWMRRGLVRRQPQHQMGSLSALDFGDYFQKSLKEEKADIVFEPGEILFFSPGRGRAVVDKGFQEDTAKQPVQEVPWILGYHPSNVSGYKAIIYSNDSGSVKDEPGTPTQYNVDMGRFPLRMRLGLRDGDGDQDPWDDPGAWRMPVNEGDRNWNWNATDGWWASRAPGAITLYNGFNGIGDSDIQAEKTNPVAPHLGKRATSPQNMQLAWYDWEDKNARTEISDEVCWNTDGSQMDPNQPFYISSLGVVPKSANMAMDTRIMPNKDYRTKLWQHSSPAFWGSSIVSPDDQQRQYHPYQLAVLDVSSGLSSSPMDCIGDNGILGINSEGEQVSFASVLELPMHPPFSLAGFAGMRLQPGWYTGSNADATAAQRRMQYQAGVPGVGIGNSFADPCIPADDVYKLHTTNHSQEVGYNKRVFGDFYDHGLLVNDSLWDRWFCSSVSDMPRRSGGKKEASEVLTEFLNGSNPLPVARYRKANTAVSNSAIVSRIMEGDGWKHIAQYLMIDGGFNVNSTSEEAWAAVLQGLARRKLVSNVDKKLSLVEGGKSNEQVLFSRFMVSTTDKSVDSLGGYSMLQGSGSFRRDGGMTAAWGEVRMLEPEQIRELARQMVKQVRERGPFLSMSDFINRRLEGANSPNSLKGALQAAIDATDINADFQEVTAARGNQGSLFVYPEAEEGSIYTAAPGYLIQSDVLASLGNILTVRDDTFTVRAYGCVKSASNAILAQAWCEAVVQRTMEYVDPSNNPEDSDFEPDGTKAKGLSRANKVLGRRFRVVSFKWLDAWDI